VRTDYLFVFADKWTHPHRNCHQIHANDNRTHRAAIILAQSNHISLVQLIRRRDGRRGMYEPVVVEPRASRGTGVLDEDLRHWSVCGSSRESQRERRAGEGEGVRKRKRVEGRR
jgi:hypothetical protein